MRWFLVATLASFLAPALADCIHSGLVVLKGIRLYQAELGDLANPYYWSFLAGRTLITLLAMSLAQALRIRDLWTWLSCVIGWLWLARQMEAVFK